MKVVQDEKELQLINNYYKNCLIKYSLNGFIQSTNRYIAQVIQTLKFNKICILSKGLVKIETAFLLHNKAYHTTFCLNDIVEYSAYNPLIHNPVYVQIKRCNDQFSFLNELNQPSINVSGEEIEEWLSEIDILNFIRKSFS